MKQFFKSLLSNNENDVSTGAVLAVTTAACWLGAFIHAQVLNLPLKVGPVEALALIGGLLAMPKIPVLGKKNDPPQS